jgi:hypothetical protein
MEKKINIPQKGAAEKWCNRLKEYASRPPPVRKSTEVKIKEDMQTALPPEKPGSMSSQ